ncbi:MAG: hypothetical protein WBV60_03470, partial [Terriglobales bacterium]
GNVFPSSCPKGVNSFAEKLSFVSGYRFSDTASRLKSDAPLGAGRRKSGSSANPKTARTHSRPADRLTTYNPRESMKQSAKLPNIHTS